MDRTNAGHYETALFKGEPVLFPLNLHQKNSRTLKRFCGNRSNRYLLHWTNGAFNRPLISQMNSVINPNVFTYVAAGNVA